MKKILILFMLTALTCMLLADLQTPIMRKAAIDEHGNKTTLNQSSLRDVPEWEFVTEPQSLLTNYYDYMPGSYNSNPVRLQPDAMGGIYITYHARETAASTRRVYHAYIDANGNVTNIATIGTEDIHEGYAGIDIDPVTGDPFVSWHVNADPGTAQLECVLSYDLYHLGSPGLWKSPFIVIDDNIPSPLAPDDEFEWPYVFIGPSPDPAKRRVYIVASNGTSSPATGDPSENVMIAYANFDVADLNLQSELDWTYRTIPLLDNWHAGTPEWIRPAQACAVSEDGKIAFMGYTVTEDATSPMTDRLYVLLNENYGEGDFEYYDADYYHEVPNPLNQDGTPRFPDENGDPHEIYFSPYLAHHMNTIFTDGGTKLRFLGNMNMMIYPDQWYPDLCLMYPKVYTYDIINNEFSFYELWIRGADPADGQVMLPWDLDEDGVVDNFDPDGYVMWEDGWPIYHFDQNVAFHEGNFKITKNEDNGWLLGIWSEGLKSRYGNGGVPGGIPVPGYEDWAEYPEIAIAISNDGGETWKEEIIMNAKADDDNFALELDGMIPEYIYVGDKIEDIGDGWGLVHLFFLDDNSYGSSIQGHGENIGGTMTYASIKIFFGTSSVDPTVTPSIISLSQNYPNPFNPNTTISYNLKEAGQVTLEVYNIKGQKVRTLVNEHKDVGRYNIEWNGKNDNKQSVSSGMYFYKMKSGVYTDTKKMILMK